MFALLWSGWSQLPFFVVRFATAATKRTKFCDKFFFQLNLKNEFCEIFNFQILENAQSSKSELVFDQLQKVKLDDFITSISYTGNDKMADKFVRRNAKLLVIAAAWYRGRVCTYHQAAPGSNISGTFVK